MPDLEPLLAAIRAGDSPDARAAVQALAEVDDDRARHALAEALAGDGPLAALASWALGKHGHAAQSFAVAATFDPDRRFAAVVALGQIGNPSSQSLLGKLIDDPDPMLRAAAIISLYRCGGRSGAIYAPRLATESSLPAFGFLAAIAGAVSPLTPAALDNLEAQARDHDTPPEIRASCAWAVGQHDVARGRAIAGDLVEIPDVSGAFADVIARRGGPLSSLGPGGDPARDRTADTLGLPKP